MNKEQLATFKTWLKEKYDSAEAASQRMHGSQDAGEASAFGQVLDYLEKLAGDE